MFSMDKTGFKELLINFYTQVDVAPSLVEEANLQINSERIRQIVYLGMGGSAITGDLLNDVLFGQLNVPISVVRGYITPGYCSANTLVIACSYSGNTEETLSALQSLSGTGAQFLCVTSGGKLGKMASENNWGCISLPTGYPPRMALGFMFFTLYHALGQAGQFNGYDDDLASLSHFFQEEIKKHDINLRSGHVLAMELAKTIQHSIPVIYSSAPFLSTVSLRWQNQIHENAKALAFRNVLPEMNHNEIVGWEMDSDVRKNLLAIFLENETPHPRIKQRIKLSKRLIKSGGNKVVDIYSNGSNILEKVFSLVILGDWVSYYLAAFYKKDPVAIENINYLKEELAKTA